MSTKIRLFMGFGMLSLAIILYANQLVACSSNKPGWRVCYPMEASLTVILALGLAGCVTISNPK